VDIASNEDLQAAMPFEPLCLLATRHVSQIIYNVFSPSGLEECSYHSKLNLAQIPLFLAKDGPKIR
jgi:hypothetical protein